MFVDLPHATADIQFALARPAYVIPYKQEPDYSFPPAAHHSLSIELANALESVEEFAAMPANWDGYGALEILEQTASNTKSALERLMVVAPAPDITPNPNGTISLEWETHEGFAHIEIGMTRYSGFVKPKVGDSHRFDGQADSITLDLGSSIAAILYPARNSAETITRIQFAGRQLRVA